MDEDRGSSSHRDTPDDRRQATILFADLSGFTAASRRMDPEDLKDAINDCFRVIERVVHDHGGSIDKYIGDCVMALFGAPMALEGAAQHAVNAAIAIRAGVDAFDVERKLVVPLRVHIGINTGLVAAGGVGGQDRRDYTVMGDAVNLAARLQSAAKDGQIFVGESTYKATIREFDYEPRFLDLKGYDKPVRAYELMSTDEHRYRAPPAGSGAGGRAPLVGRDAELEWVVAKLGSLRAGTGAVVTVVGENGMGKSRLLAEALAAPVVSELELMEGRCLAVGTSLAFHPFVDFLRTWSGVGENVDSRLVYDAFALKTRDLPLADRREVLDAAALLLGVQAHAGVDARLADVEGEALERVIRVAFTDLLATVGARKPTLFVIEDLHWADHASVRLLEALLPLASSARIAFLLLARPHYVETTEHVLAFVDERLSEVRSQIRLSPLGAAATAELAANVAGNTILAPKIQALIAERTEGNPFYVEEVVRDLVDRSRDQGPNVQAADLPATIEGVIRARVDRLDDAAKRVLQVAAVVGRRFERDVVIELLSDEFDVDIALATLVERQLLDPIESRWTASQKVVRLLASREYSFRHALIQEAIYSALLRKTRRDLHARCAAVIERRFAGHMQDAFGMLAYHYLQADNLEKAEEYTIKAGELAARSAASHEALHYFREAYRIYNRIHGASGDKAKRAELERNVGQALFNTGNLAESVEHFDAALALYGQWLPRSTRARWVKFALDMGGLLLCLQRGKHRAGTRDNPVDQAIGQVLYNRARAENPTDPVRYVFDTIAASRYVQRLDPHKCAYACEITATTGAFFSFGGISTGIARKFLAESALLVREKRSADEFSYRAMGTVVEFHAGDWSGRYDIDDDLMNVGLRAGRLWAADTYLGMVAERSYRQGKFDAADRDIARLRTLRADYGYDFAASTETAHTAFALFEKGRLDDAARAMKTYYDIRREDALHVLALSGMAKIAATAGRIEEAQDHLARAGEIVARASRLAPYYLGAYQTARLLVDVLELERRPSGKRERAATARSSKLAVAAAKRIAREQPEALRLSARAAWLSGASDRALELYGRALDVAQALAAAPETARASREVAALLDGGAGVRSYREMGAGTWRSRAAETFAGIGLLADATALGYEAPADVEAAERPKPRAVVRVNGK